MKKYIYTLLGVFMTLIGVGSTYLFFKNDSSWMSIVYCLGSVILLEPAIDKWTTFFKNLL
jgi:hypothetical protein